MATIFKLFAYWLISLIGLSSFSHIEATNNGFTLDLIHRDSPRSPFYNPHNSHFDRLRNSFYRSMSRITHFMPNSVSGKTLQSDIVPSGGEYLMRISIGTPPVEALAIADTGSDLIWFQCQPCNPCYKQKSPVFDPRRSSTYREVSCGTTICNALDSDVRACTQDVKTCGYTYSYGDHSFTDGKLALEKFTIDSTDGRPVCLPEVAFGCGNRNGGTFDEVGSGIIGLGRGTLSLISQLDTQIRGKFSYCLVAAPEESNITSKINFGASAIDSGPDFISTPLVSRVPDTFYYLTLEAISVGNKRLPYKDSWNGNVENGNIIIDSGTTLTFLNSKFFSGLESALEEAIKAKHVSDPQGLFSICFKDVIDSDLPFITVHFTNADVTLQPVNTFVKVEEDLLCFAMVPSSGIAIFGNLSQMDFMIAYDLEKKAVSFKPTDCTKHW